jgi:hypothetical protein
MPFTDSEFLDVFAAYNQAMWPAAAALWLASLAVVVAFIRSGSHAHRAVSALLAVHWVWSATVYHAAFFARINPAAWVFASMFLLQAALFVWFGMVRRRLRFSWRRSARHMLAGGLVAYALAYPIINTADSLAYPRMPTFGVPCPTTILTAGMLLAAETLPGSLVIVPVLWSIIGGSAAFLFGVKADLVLLLTGSFLAVRTVALSRRSSATERTHTQSA